jgi:hypothetical protein
MSPHKFPTIKNDCDPEVAKLLILEPTIGLERQRGREVWC